MCLLQPVRLRDVSQGSDGLVQAPQQFTLTVSFSRSNDEAHGNVLFILIFTVAADRKTDAVHEQVDDDDFRNGALGRLCCGALQVIGDLQTAREGCNHQYPMRIGNYLPHANCVNAAIETYALAGARYPDLIRLQVQVRAALSAKIDSRRISVQTGERRMAEADRLVAAAERDRDAGNERAASRRIAAIEQMLK